MTYLYRGKFNLYKNGFECYRSLIWGGLHVNKIVGKNLPPPAVFYLYRFCRPSSVHIVGLLYRRLISNRGHDYKIDACHLIILVLPGHSYSSIFNNFFDLDTVHMNLVPIKIIDCLSTQ